MSEHNQSNVSIYFDLIKKFFLDDKNDKLSEKILAGLETIDDEMDSSDILLVKVSEIQEAREEFGDDVVGDELPSLVIFDEKIPTRFEGNKKFGKQVKYSVMNCDLVCDRQL